MSTHPFPDSINVRELRERLVHYNKLPKDYSFGPQIMTLFNTWNTAARDYNIIVKPHVPRTDGRRASKHRIFVLCSCGREIPIGRVTQHTHKE
jgi:hypothetical protein